MQKTKRKPSLRQKKFVENVIQGNLAGGISLTEAKIAAGYSPTTSVTGLMETQGVKGYLSKYQLTEERFAQYLSEDLENKPQNRLGELTLLAKVLGLDKQTVDLNVNKVDESLDLIRSIIKKSYDESE